MSDAAAAAQLRSIHVVAGVIRDASGRILLARRTDGRDLAGLWEFPGGKVEPGEAPADALARELHEELGIEAEIGEALICVPQRYADKRLRLDVRRIQHWRGTARGREGQALAWVPADRLSRYAMPPADRPVVAALEKPALYLVTPEPGADDDAWLRGLQRAIATGITRVQLRARNVDAARWQRLTEQAVRLCEGAGIEVFVNGDAALAQRLGAGLHLRSGQLAELRERPATGNGVLAASCHDLAELQAAQALACDFVVLGPVAPTASHPGETGIGWDGFAALREDVSLPIYAIGGMHGADVDRARAHGAQGIAAIRALWPGHHE